MKKYIYKRKNCKKISMKEKKEGLQRCCSIGDTVAMTSQQTERRGGAMTSQQTGRRRAGYPCGKTAGHSERRENRREQRRARNPTENRRAQ